MPADHAVQHREKQWRMLILGRNKTVVVTGASQGIGAAIAAELLKRGYDVVATSRSVSRAGFASPPQLALVDGGIILEAASENITRTAVEKFGSINHVVNNAGILGGELFLEYSIDDIRSFVSTNLDGFIFLTRLTVIQAPEAPELPAIKRWF
jgi:NAD(P)-dependent dehydrogenase (short-subunit alcohol dehydrogenase family)